MKKPDMQIAVNPDIAYRYDENELFMLTADSKFHNISEESGIHIFRYIETKPFCSENEILKSIIEKFDVDEIAAKKDITEFIADGI